MRRATPVLGIVAGLIVAIGAAAGAWLVWPGMPVAPVAPGSVSTAEAPEGAPNLVLVIGCTVRRDQLAPYGGLPAATPHLQRLAEGGAVFEDVVAAAPWTKASATAILTGHHAISVGMVEPAHSRNELVLDERVPTLAERLAARGYRTVGATGNPNLNRAFGLGRGFDEYRDGVEIETTKALGTDLVAGVLADLRATDDGRPFFAQLTLVDAHAPRDVSYPDLKAWAGPGVPRGLAAYRATLHEVDRALGALDAGLRELGVADRTIVLLVADHGEGLGVPKHHGKAHGSKVFPTTISVPWVAWGPGIAAGHRISGLASHVDIVPTVLGLLEAPADPALTGSDWSAQLSGASDRTTRTRAFSDTWFYGKSRAAVWTSERQCQHDFGSGREGDMVDGCHDRAADPEFRHPFEDRALEAELVAWRKARVAELEAWGPVQRVEPDAALGAQLEALGYRE